MKIYKGTTGLNQTFQDDFKKTISCCKCGKEAKIMFVAIETGEKGEKWICDMHETTGKKGGLWFHDAVSVGVYACRNCLEITAIANQA